MPCSALDPAICCFNSSGPPSLSVFKQHLTILFAEGLPAEHVLMVNLGLLAVVSGLKKYNTETALAKSFKTLQQEQ